MAINASEHLLAEMVLDNLAEPELLAQEITENLESALQSSREIASKI